LTLTSSKLQQHLITCYLKPVKLLRLFVVLALAAAFAIAVALNLRTIPARNTSATHFDTIIVLGYPANLDGTPSPNERARVLEGIREYNSGVAPFLIMTGGAAHNRFVEAHVMAAFAVSQGVPLSAIIEEPQAQNTIQNVYYSSQIMQARHWRSAEVVSSSAHIRRAAMILTRFANAQPTLAFNWSTHAAPWPPEYGLLHRLGISVREAAYCLYIRIFGLPHSRFLPAR
jgi:uncharacterized SAM-binding protein YcdF (DUF218 family)